MPERLAVISDVHGNLTALEAVLADIDARGITWVFNLGDVIGKGPRGSECIALCRRRCELTVRGNWDAFISRDETQLWGGAQWTRDQLGAGDLAWLAALPSSHDLLIGGRPVRFFHASNVSEFHRVHYHHTDGQFAAMFTNTDFTGGGPEPHVVGYGDIHVVYLEGRPGSHAVQRGLGRQPARCPRRPVRHPRGRHRCSVRPAGADYFRTGALRRRGRDRGGSRPRDAGRRRLRP